MEPDVEDLYFGRTVEEINRRRAALDLMECVEHAAARSKELGIPVKFPVAGMTVGATTISVSVKSAPRQGS